MSGERLAVFVYGTLRPGNGNARLWQGAATERHDGEATVLGYALVSGGGFPYAVPATMAQTVGTLIDADGGCYERLLASLDALEGYTPGRRHNHYERIVVAVMTPAGPERAWMYVVANAERIAELPDVPTNEAGQFDWAWRRPLNRLA